MNQHHEITSLQQWLEWMTEQSLTAIPDKNGQAHFFDSLEAALLHEITDEKSRKKISLLVSEIKRLSGNTIGAFLEELWVELHKKAEKGSQHHKDDSAADIVMAQQVVSARDKIDDYPARISDSLLDESLDQSFDELCSSLREEGVDFSRYADGCYGNPVCRLVNMIVAPLPDNLPVLWESIFTWLNINQKYFYLASVILDDEDGFLFSSSNNAAHDISPRNRSMEQNDYTEHPVEVQTETHADTADVTNNISNENISSVMTGAEYPGPVTQSVHLLAGWMSSSDYTPQKAASVIAKIVPAIIPILHTSSHVFARYM